MADAVQDLADRAKSSNNNKKDKKEKKDKPEKKDKQEKMAKQQKDKPAANADTKGLSVTRAEDLGVWYSEMLTKAGIVSYYDIRDFFDPKIKTIGVRNCYYPLFITRDNLEKEQDHVEGFSAEVAWVDRGGKSKLEKPLAVRPTSETAMYKDFADKIHSHRDLPFKRNQWNNVVRWEFTHCQPLLRSREFLWQEGHTAHLTKESADEEVLQILDWYADIYEELLAVPVVKGKKTENEKFPGALYTTTIESFIETNGRAIQAGTSHALGQNFARMYNITVEDPAASKTADGESQKLLVWQNSWGLSTRSLGTMLMIHGDDKGAVFPPRVAEFQAALIPVGLTAKTTDADKASLLDGIAAIAKTLTAAGIRVHADTRAHYSPGWKFAEYELRGFPLRIEYGPKDAAKGAVTTVRRDTGAKGVIELANIGADVSALLETMQTEMLERAAATYRAHIKYTTAWDEVVPLLNAKNVIRMPHCGGGACADAVKKETAEICKTENMDPRAPSMGAKALCVPFEQKDLEEGALCTRPSCGQKAVNWTQFGRSY